MKTQFSERYWRKLNPGDKVAFDPPKNLPQELYPDGPRYSTHHLKGKMIYSVRKAGIHPISGLPVVWLSGIFGYPGEHFGEEPFYAAVFKLISKAEGAAPVTIPECISVPVILPAAVVDALKGLPLYPRVESLFMLNKSDWLPSVCRRWEAAVATTGMRLSHSDAHAEVCSSLAAGSTSRVLSVPLSPIGQEHLREITGSLGISPEAWLQGVLSNLAASTVKYRENYARRELVEDRQRAARAARDRTRTLRNLPHPELPAEIRERMQRQRLEELERRKREQGNTED